MLEFKNGLSHESRWQPRGHFQDGDKGMPERTSIARCSELAHGHVVRSSSLTT